MYRAVKEWFKNKLNKPKKYAFTNTSTKLGFDDPPTSSLHADLLLAQSKLLRSKPITLEELNLLSKHIFNSEVITGNLFKINVDMLKNSVFELTRVYSVGDYAGIDSIHLDLKEIVYGADIHLHINIEDHHEFLIPFAIEESEKT